MTVTIEVEDAAWNALPGLEDLACRAIDATLDAALPDAEPVDVSLLFTDDTAIAAINAEWRGKAGPTNVLSFPTPPGMPMPEDEPRPLGDIVLASGVVAHEAHEQGKSLHAHTSHLIVHGMLHLLGHDHENDDDAHAMEQLEIEILKGLGVSNPYERV